MIGQAPTASLGSGPPRTGGLSLILPGGQTDLAGLAAGQVGQGAVMDDSGSNYRFPDRQLRPRKRVAIGRIYMPIAVWAHTPAAQPSEAQLRVSFLVRSEVRWTSGGAIPLAAASAALVVGNGVFSEDLTNPVELDLLDTFDLTFSLQFDSAVTDAHVAVSRGIQNDGVIFPSVGAIYFTFED